MDARKHNHINLTAWEQLANERGEKAIMLITTFNGDVTDGCDIYTGLDSEALIIVLEKALERVKKGVTPTTIPIIKGK